LYICERKFCVIYNSKMSDFQKSSNTKVDLSHSVDTGFAPVENRFSTLFMGTDLPRRSCLSQNKKVKEENEDVKS